MKIEIAPSWKDKLKDEFEKPYFQNLEMFVKDAYQKQQVFPPSSEIYNAFAHCTFENTKVVILGQDPYHGPGQAHGLAFSVREGMPFPPSLRNIFKELKSDMSQDVPWQGNLDHWADQGVLLLNATLTVEANKAGSHQGKGWEEFTDAVIRKLAEDKENLVFILWGAYAQKKAGFISEDRHLKLMAPHPSPLSAHRGFFGSAPFSQTNDYLRAHGKEAILW
ncbi:uracil-DNA glycosylase [Echinicola pacifica]|uniref:Uracil-DNA glycosylase n=1 Tax=Echinicola pacifica TaxID=346377 RepID=A0A918PXT9_9BACT|nr:uracil-DNA glycosylase [Echinicola pacifica]GGZ26675.1 uracil-DNA glycosylase [Echinicola pacifica]